MKQNYTCPTTKGAKFPTKREFKGKSGHKDSTKHPNTSIPSTVARMK